MSGRRPPLAPLLLLPLSLLPVLPGCEDEGGACAPICRPTADGQGVEIVLPCEGEAYTAGEPCDQSFHAVPDPEGGEAPLCTDRLQHQCEIRTYAGSGERYRVCIVDAVVVGAQTYDVPGDTCDYAWIDVRVDRKLRPDELSDDCEQPVPEDFCSVSEIGYSFCGYETAGCHWPPNPYL